MKTPKIANIDTLLAAVAESETAAGTLRARVADVRREIADTQDAITTMLDALVPRTELAGRIEQVVAEHAATWREDHPHGPLADLATYDQQPKVNTRVLDFGALCAGQPRLAVALLTGLMAPAYDEGVPSDDRPAAVAKLREQLQALEQAEEGLVDRLNASGLAFAHRPEVVARRATEAARQQREQQDRERAERTAATVNSRAVAGPRRRRV